MGNETKEGKVKSYRLKVGKMYFCGYSFCVAGNAVVPQVAEWVALKVLESMEKYK